MASYSLAITGVSADNAQQPSNILIDDAYVQRTGDIRQAMAQNTQMLCQLPDGSQAWFTFDAERSRPGVLRVLKRVGP